VYVFVMRTCVVRVSVKKRRSGESVRVGVWSIVSLVWLSMEICFYDSFDRLLLRDLLKLIGLCDQCTFRSALVSPTRFLATRA
jgi:hypothetical protein